MSDEQRVIMMMGIGRSGKSRCASELRRLGWRVVEGKHSDEHAKQQFVKFLNEGKDVVIDRCNLTSEERLQWFKSIQQEGQLNTDMHWFALVMDTHSQKHISRLRSAGLGDSQQLNDNTEEFQHPKVSEGFHEILYYTDVYSELTSYFGKAREYHNSVIQKSLSVNPATKVHSEDSRYSIGFSKDSPGKVVIEKGEIILLFDLNGTLTSHTSIRRSSGSNQLRPGVKKLLQLKERFRLGVFTSSTIRTVQTVLQMFSRELGEELFDPDLVFYRDHTHPVSKSFARKMGLKPWDTIKPLSPLFSDLSRVVLFDDDEWKSAKGEEQNMVIVPCWQKDELQDTLLKNLVDEIQATFGNLSDTQDVRKFTKMLSKALSITTENSDNQKTNNILTYTKKTDITNFTTSITRNSAFEQQKRQQKEHPFTALTARTRERDAW